MLNTGLIILSLCMPLIAFVCLKISLHLREKSEQRNQEMNDIMNKHKGQLIVHPAFDKRNKTSSKVEPEKKKVA